MSGQLPPFPLSWSHYVRLLSVQDLPARRFCEEQALLRVVRSPVDRQIALSVLRAFESGAAELVAKGTRRTTLRPTNTSDLRARISV